MSPADDDGFHSVVWDDAPRRAPGLSEITGGGVGGAGAGTGSGAADDDDDGFDAISPGDAASAASALPSPTGGDKGKGRALDAAAGAGAREAGAAAQVLVGPGHGTDGYEWDGRWMRIEIADAVKEHEGSKDMFVSYAVRTHTNLPGFPAAPPPVRRRFQDFVFLHDHLAKNFPACIVPPIPDKHRLEYIKGDRFAPEFVEKRRLDLQRFADRIASHPTLQRSQLVSDFLQSAQWTVAKHTHLAHPPPDAHSSLVDSLSDTFINAFARVRKPDARFVDMADGLERFEEGLAQVEKLVGRGKNRVEDLATDYQDMAAAYQGLGYLESGITEPLNRFAEKMLDFSTLLRHANAAAAEPFLASAHSLLGYAGAHRAVIKLRDQKQLDFEELSAYLSAVVAERDRLAAISSGHAGAPVGLGTYLRDQVDRLRGTDDVVHRREKMRKLDGKISELQDAVTGAHETSTAFSEQVVREHAIFELEREHEMKDMLGAYADGQVDMFQRAMDDWDRIIPLLQRIRVDV